MNIKDFLIDNYIWILVIILITIITIIGFLADKKRGNKASTKTQPANPNINGAQPNNMNQMQYQQPVEQIQNQMNNNMGMTYNNLNNSVPPVNQNVNIPNNQELGNATAMNTMVDNSQTVNTIPMSADINSMNNPQPVENITQNAIQEPMYQPLSEQKPNIPPQPVQNFSNMQNNNQEMLQQPIENNMTQNSPNVIPMGGTLQGMPQPVVEQPMMQTPNYNVPTPMAQQMDNNNNFNNQIAQPMPNVNQNNTTIPSPVSPIPQPVNPQPIIQNSYNNMQQMPQHNYGGAMQPNTQTMNQQPAQQTTTPQPINFVFGPQNNNQNM